MLIPELRQEARDGVLYLEALCGERLDEVPVAQRDQWTSGVRDTFSNMDVDINRPEMANAAFVGARMAIATLMSPNPKSGTAAAHLLRYLMDKADGYEDTTKRRRFRIWLGSKVLPKQ